MTSVAKTVPSTPWERRTKYIGCIVQYEVSKRFREAVKPRRAKARKNENGNQSRQSLNHPLAQLCSQLSRLLYTPCLPDKKHRYPPPRGNRIFQCFVAPPTASHYCGSPLRENISRATGNLFYASVWRKKRRKLSISRGFYFFWKRLTLWQYYINVFSLIRV